MDELKLSASEWNVLNCLWADSPRTVMQLVAELERSVGWAKSTTITTLRRMEDKGLVLCRTQGRTKHYSPAVSKDRAVRRETRSFLDKVYQGSVGMMVSAMAEDKALSRAEIDELYEILRRAEEGET